MGRRRVGLGLRVLLAGIAATAASVTGFMATAEADPEPCGYVRYSIEGTSSTVSSIPYCQHPCPGGPEAGGVPFGVNDVATVEPFVCVKGL